jgi:hypothetical protein
MIFPLLVNQERVLFTNILKGRKFALPVLQKWGKNVGHLPMLSMS